MALDRSKRQNDNDPSYGPDIRKPYQHDYDRILYSSALRRLAEVTQIFNPSEGVIFHNRLTHTIKVSQIARRLTQTLRENKLYDSQLFNAMGGLNEEVVAAAALAHDLGNPPFGHAAEDELDNLIVGEAQKSGIYVDGFEGNAQSFRIVTTLSRHSVNDKGMNLTRAVLNAMLKYPWPRPDKMKQKFGFYLSEKECFDFAREKVRRFGDKKSLEAAIMDIADDITYGIHDLFDLIRSDLIPLRTYEEQVNRLKNLIKEKPKQFLSIIEDPFFTEIKNLIDILKTVDEEWAPTWDVKPINIINRVINFFEFYGSVLPVDQYKGTKVQKILLKQLERFLITRFIDSAQLPTTADYSKPFLFLDKTTSDDLIIIKAITMNYILHSHSLVKQQRGERKIIQELFYAYRDAIINPKYRAMIPTRCLEELEFYNINDMKNPLAYRIIGDAISSLSDSEAISTFSVLTGVQPGSVFDKLSI